MREHPHAHAREVKENVCARARDTLSHVFSRVEVLLLSDFNTIFFFALAPL